VVLGGSQDFNAIATLNDGSTAAPSVTWNATGGTIDPSGKYTAGPVAGNYAVTATAANGVADTAAVVVTETTPIAIDLSLSPTSASVPVGGSKQFTATERSTDGATVPAAPKYVATGGTVSPTGMYHASQTPGTYRIIATDTVDNLADTSAVTITPIGVTLQSVVLTPATASVAEGAKQQFNASGQMSDGSTVPLSPSFTATGGMISSSGEYTAGNTAGTYRVIATDPASGKADTSSVTIIAPPATLQAVVLTPSTISLTAGGTQQFSASGRMSDGSTSAVTVTWSASGGTISSAGFFTAGQTAGTFRAIATQSGGSLADTATVTVTAPTPPPPTASACAGALRTVNVSTASGLTGAIGVAQPGDCITMAAGTYALTSALTMARSGTSSASIVVEGAGSSTILDVNQKGFNLDGSYVHLRKFRITDMGATGLWVRGAHDDVLDSMEIDHAQQELFALKDGAHHNTVQNSYFHDSGVGKGPYGEGVYVGTWNIASYGNRVLYNRFERIWTESIDIKDSSHETLVQGNIIDGSGTQFYNFNAVSLIAVNSSNNTIIGNTLSYGSPHGIIFFAGTGSLVQGNTIHLYDIHGYGGSIGIKAPNGSATVKCDNVVDHIVGGGAAYSVPCTP
jgi:parallel beta-helix repeat protein